MLNILELATGSLALSIHLDNVEEVRETFAEHGYWYAMGELFEEFTCNGSYTFFSGGDANPFVGLTDADCIAESMYVDDDGKNSIGGRCWFDPNSYVRTALDRMLDGEIVLFQLVK